MRQYTVSVPVGTATGHQCFTVSANSEEEAIEAVKQGNGEFAFEEIEIQNLEYENAKVID